MGRRSGLVGRLVAHLHGEVAASALEAYHRAGSMVYDLRDRLEELGWDAVVARHDPWSLPPAMQAAKLCGWNAFALQVIGDELLEADYRCNPRTVGYVEPLTARQALACYGQVAGWLSRARQALHDELYELDVDVPASLPPWVEPEVCPVAHVRGLLGAVERLRRHADAAVWDSKLTEDRGGPAAARGKIRRLLAEAETAAEYAARMTPGLDDGDDLLTKELTAHSRAALERYYLVGQLSAQPELALRRLPRLRTARGRPGRAPLLPRPGQSGFDPWCLTDPRIVRVVRRDDQAREAVERLWERDPDPTRTLAIKAHIDGALYRDDVAYEVGHYFSCPWSQVYLVKRPVRLAHTSLRTLEQFTYDVSIERGGHFRRQLLVGPFYPTERVGYGDEDSPELRR